MAVNAPVRGLVGYSRNSFFWIAFVTRHSDDDDDESWEEEDDESDMFWLSF